MDSLNLPCRICLPVNSCYMHWGISYLCENIQDLRQDVRALHTRIDARFALLLTVMIGLNGLVIGSVVAALRFYLPAQ